MRLASGSRRPSPRTDPKPVTLAPARFAEAYVDADGFRVRYMEAGSGAPLVWLHAAGGPRLSRAHELLAERYRVIAFEVPGFGTSPPNERSRSYDDLASTIAHAITAVGLERFRLWGTSFGGRLALWLGSQHSETVEALVLESPTAIASEGTRPPSGTPEELRQLLYAHPERQPEFPPPDPAVLAKQRELLERLGQPTVDETEDRLRRVTAPTLAVFGTRDRVVPSEMGRVYRQKMPNCNYVLVYDAGHAIGADRPEAFASLVTDFLERREAFIVTQRSALLHP
jgi:pimeloyl-ACP methyl ester carboxylesterase